MNEKKYNSIARTWRKNEIEKEFLFCWSHLYILMQLQKNKLRWYENTTVARFFYRILGLADMSEFKKIAMLGFCQFILKVGYY